MMGCPKKLVSKAYSFGNIIVGKLILTGVKCVF
jgi:hypothetical protein